jgi:hypothetical protein
MKPLNKVALLVWALAAVSLILNAVEFWGTYQNFAGLREQAGEASLWWSMLARSTSTIVMQFAALVGLGTLIEIADRILWQVRKPD